MKNITLAIAGFLTGIILFQFMFYSCEKRKLNKQIALCKQEVAACVNAPVKIDTVIVENVLKDTIYLTYRYKVKDTVYQSDAISWIDQSVEQRVYTGSYEHPQFTVHWTADVTGTLDKLTINPPSLIKSLVITKERTVDLTEYQTPTNKEKSHLYATMGSDFTFKDIQNIDIALMWIHRKGFGLRAGIGTDFEQLNYNAGLVIKIK